MPRPILACAAALAVLLPALLFPGVAFSASSPLTRIGSASPSEPLQLVLPLNADLAGLEAYAQAVSTPGSPQYGHYLSIPELSRRFGASPAVRANVVGYLSRIGARGVRIDATGLFADATVPAVTAARVFSTPLSRFRVDRAGTFTAPTGRTSVPGALRGTISGVVGLDTQPLASAAGRRAAPGARAAVRARAASTSSALPHSGTSSGCQGGQSAGEVNGNPATAGFTPNQYLTAYGYSALQGSGLEGQGERVALIEIDGFTSSDISTFASCFGLAVPPIHAFGVGVGHPLAPGGESTLDLEALDAAAPALDGIDVYETQATAANALRALTAPLQNRGYHPQVISASFGLCEPAIAAAVGGAGLRSSEAALAMAAASGTTFLASSGDSGSADCTTSDGTPLRRLAVNYPASSPYVTGVGGTNFSLSGDNGIARQLVWNDAGVDPGSAGGGGSSGLFRRPYYQSGTVKRNRRAVPDVSMLADVIPGYAIYCTAPSDCVNSHDSNPWQAVGGTSAGTPLLAGGFALIDQELRLHQRQPLGLVNPILYTIGRSASLRAQAFSDVLQYGNDVGPYIPGSGRPLGCCTAGGGFDLASGWGSLNLVGFLSPALSLSQPLISLSVPAHQHPLRSGVIRATVSCSAACRIGAFATVRIGSGKPFQVASGVVQLGSAGDRGLRIRLSRKVRGRLHSALAHHRKVRITVYGATIRGRSTIASQTPGQSLPFG